MQAGHRESTTTRRLGAALVAFVTFASTLLLAPASVGAQSSSDTIDWDYNDFWYETPEGFRTTDTDNDGIDPWGCEAYEYPYAVADFWEVEPQNSIPGNASSQATVEANFDRIINAESDCWYNAEAFPGEGAIDLINYFRAYHGVPPVKPWFSNEHALASSQAQVDCNCPFQHWGEISQQFNDDFPGVIGVELRAGSGLTGLYSSEFHRPSLLDPSFDYVSIGSARPGDATVLMIRLDSTAPDLTFNFRNVFDRYDSLEDRNWQVGPEAEPFFSAGQNYDFWTLAVNTGQTTRPEGSRLTPGIVDPSFNPHPIDPNNGPLVTWEQPQQHGDLTEAREQVLELLNTYRASLNADDANWPNLNPEPLSLYEQDRPDPRSQAQFGYEDGFWLQGYFDEGVFPFGITQNKNNESFDSIRGNIPGTRTILAVGIGILDEDQRYRTLLNPSINEVEINVECALVDGERNGSFQVWITGITNLDTFVPGSFPRGNEIDGFQQGALDALTQYGDGQLIYAENLCPTDSVDWRDRNGVLPSTTTTTAPPVTTTTTAPAPTTTTTVAPVAPTTTAPVTTTTVPQSLNEPSTTVHTCNGLVATIVGTDGNDTLTGTSGADVIVGLEGNDTIIGLEGNDTICGNEGADDISGGYGEDYIDAGTGHDEVRGNQDDDVLIGNRGDDFLHGGQNDDTIEGGSGDDDIVGGSGHDTISGNDGDDFILGNAGADTLNGNLGDDVIRGGSAADVIDGGYGDDDLHGQLGPDTVLGNVGNDRIAGGSGHDTLRGGKGEDLMFGGKGDDTFFGGSDNDRFRGGEGFDTASGGAGTDLANSAVEVLNNASYQ